MDRIWLANVSDTPPSLPTTPLLGYPQALNPAAPTQPGPWWFHMLTEEVRNAIVAAGLAPDGGDLTQLSQAIGQLALTVVVNELAEYPPNSVGDQITVINNFITQLVTDLTGYALRAGGNVFTGAQVVTPVVLADAATIATDASLSNSFTLTLGGNRTLANPTNLQNGVILEWKIKQPATGGPYTLALGNKFKTPGGAFPSPLLSTAANAIDVVIAKYWGDDDILDTVVRKAIA